VAISPWWLLDDGSRVIAGLRRTNRFARIVAKNKPKILPLL
jgi:hypothetical protein